MPDDRMGERNGRTVPATLDHRIILPVATLVRPLEDTARPTAISLDMLADWAHCKALRWHSASRVPTARASRNKIAEGSRP